MTGGVNIKQKSRFYGSVGKSFPKLDAPDKVVGIAKYVMDVKIPGMLYAKVLRSPVPHARIKRIDTSKAERVKGVGAVITHKNVSRVPYNSTPHPGTTPKDKYVLDNKVRYVGDEVAAVAAVDEDTAEEALELIDVDYEELPAVFDPEEAMEPGAPRIHEAKNNICTSIFKEWGDVKKGFAKADYIFEDRYETPGQHSCPLEPHACLASYESGNLRVWSSVQMPHPAVIVLSEIFGIPQNRIRITMPYTGGAFGNKAELSLEPICISLAMKAKKPVKMELTRKEVFLTTRRHPSIVTLKTGVKRDGTFTARQVKGILDGGAYASHSSGVAFYFGANSVGLVSLYRTPNFKCETIAAYTNTSISGAFRGYGNPQGAFPLESQLDQIADELSIDPIQLRLKNIIQPGDIDPATSLRIRSSGLIDCAEWIKKEMSWVQKRKKGLGVQGKKKRTGCGIAFLMHPTGCAPGLDQTCSAIVKINSDGTVNIQSAAVDLGSGAKTTLVQIASEELNVKMDYITITEDSDTIYPFDRGSYGSGTLYISGEAVRLAAADAKNQLLKEASKKLNVKINGLGIKDGYVFVKGKPKKRISIGEISSSMPSGEIVAMSTYKPLFNAPYFGAQGAEVEVDMESGDIRILKMLYAHDIGKAINPVIVEGQLEGGMVQGLGYATTENILISEKNGEFLNPSLIDYKLPRARDIPKIKVMLAESREDTAPFSGKGCGEACLVPTAPAIANAVFNATGIRFKDFPITPEKMIKELKR
ncbi:MAG: molybdopterin cofactor-binding domain-containing protein [Methanobacteriota archaeon]